MAVPTRRTWLKTLAAGCGSPFVGTAAAARPNILLIMADDHSAGAIGCYGSYRNQTPHIDRLAAEGMRFDRCLCVNSICTPSRAAILTGKYAHLNGVRTLNERLDASQATFPRLLQKAGYHTGLVGKWHLSGSGCDPAPAGFDYWNILPGQGRYFDPVMFEMGARKTRPGHVTDVTTELSVEFLEKRDRSKPFLLMCHHKAPHGVWEFHPRHAGLFPGRVREPDTFRDDYKERASPAAHNSEYDFANMARRMQAPDWPTKPLDVAGASPEAAQAAAYQKFIRDYMRCVAGLDESVGRLLDYLETHGLARNTIVIYTSDQGVFLGEHGWYDKRFFYEESIRMPLLVRFPDEVARRTSASRMVLNVDFAPTLLDFAGVAAPAAMQGRSFRPLLRGAIPGDWRKSMLYMYYMESSVPPHYGVRTDRHKLIRYPRTGEWELFDLETDPSELHNLYGRADQARNFSELEAELGRLCSRFAVPPEELAAMRAQPGRGPG